MFEYSLGKTKSQLVLKHAKVMNVFSNEWIEQDIAIQYGTIVGVGAYEGETEIDLTGKYVVPGFIDAHMHIESTLVAPEELSKVLLAQGTTTILSDPHELVNVKGAEALDYVLQAGRNTTLDIYTMLPSSVPCFDKDTNGAGEFTAAQMSAYIDDPNVIGLGEVMRVKELEAYRFADILTDHESSTYEEALDKLRCGFYVLIREGSQAKNLEPIVKGFLAHGIPFTRTAFCTDDRHLDDILNEGHISHCIQKAIALGVDEFTAYKMATLHPATIYGLRRKGAVAAGYQADLVVLNDPKTVAIDCVYKNGHKATLKHLKAIEPSEDLLHTVVIPEVLKEDIQIKRRDKNHVIEVESDSLLTKHVEEEVPGYVYFEPEAPYNKAVVVERHGKNGNIATAILKGFNLTQGAIGSTIAHDSHNMILVGDNDDDILLAAKTLEHFQGGYVLVQNHEVKKTRIRWACRLPWIRFRRFRFWRCPSSRRSAFWMAACTMSCRNNLSSLSIS